MSNRIFQTLDPEKLDKYGIPAEFDDAKLLPVQSPQGSSGSERGGAKERSRQRLVQLDLLKKRMEQYMTFLEEEVQNPANEFNMRSIHESVLTADGFPRNDVHDLVLVQFIKHNWNRTHNDYTKLRERIYTELAAFHSLPADVPSVASADGTPEMGKLSLSNTKPEVQGHRAFLKISNIVKDSAADLAGLQENDLVITMEVATGTDEPHTQEEQWNKTFFERIIPGLRLLKISEFFKKNLNNNIHLTVARAGHTQTLELVLTPRHINGSILGCKIALV